MKKQLTLTANDFERYRKPTRREKFLAEMNILVPWTELAAVIEPYYPKTTSAGGRPPVGLERMLRIHCLQLRFDLSDPAVDEALYDSLAMRSLVGIGLGRDRWRNSLCGLLRLGGNRSKRTDECGDAFVTTQFAKGLFGFQEACGHPA